LNYRQWTAVVLLTALSNAGTLWVTKNYLIPQPPKVVDLVSLFDTPKLDAARRMINGELSEAEYREEERRRIERFEAIMRNMEGTVFLRQCIVGGDGYSDITEEVEAAVSE